MKLNRVVLWLATALLAACGGEERKDYTELKDPAQIQKVRQDLKKAPQFDISKVVVARLTVNGEPVEATSLAPSVIKGKEGASTTVLTIDNKEQILSLTTFDEGKSVAYQTTIDLKAPQKHTIVFPMVGKGGKVDEAQWNLVKVLTR
jgi:hypothetical protein